MSSWKIEVRGQDVALTRTHVMNYHGGFFKKITTEWRIAAEDNKLVARVSQKLANGQPIGKKSDAAEIFPLAALDTDDGRFAMSKKIGVESFMLAAYKDAVIASRPADEIKAKKAPQGPSLVQSLPAPVLSLDRAA